MMGVRSTRAETLRALVNAVTSAAETVLQEWEHEETVQDASEPLDSLPSAKLYAAQRTIIAACGSFIELLQAPGERIITLAFAFLQSRSLQIAGEHAIANHLARADQSNGMHLTHLSQLTGVQSTKLGPIMRTLCSAHVFAEVEQDRFANNRISAALVSNENLHAWLNIISKWVFSSANKLPEYIKDNEAKSLQTTAFQRAFQTQLSAYGFMNAEEQRIMGLAMVAAGRLGRGVFYDYPWNKLGTATVVDIGGGLGGMSLDLCKIYPQLRFVIQDLPDVVAQGPALWQRELPSALESDHVTFMAHDFFLENPVKAADVYILRHVLHNWDDDRCITILSKLRVALAPHSRILVVDVVAHTTVGSGETKIAPAPLLANYGIASAYAHAMGLTMMAVFEAVERTPAEFQGLAERAGLEIVAIWDCRGIVSIVEMRSKDVSG